MTYTEEMTTSEILLRLASMRNELLQAVNDIEKISKNICYKAEQTESCSEKPNNCKDLQDWKDRMWAEAIVTEPTISKMEQVDKSQEESISCLIMAQGIDCENCSRRFTCHEQPTIEERSCDNCNQKHCFVCIAHRYYHYYYEPKDEPQTDCGDFADRLAYERGVKHAWEVAQKVFDSTVTFYEAEDVAKQIDKDINVRSKDEPQTNADQHVQHVESVEPTWTREKDEPQKRCDECIHFDKPYKKRDKDGMLIIGVECDGMDEPCDKWTDEPQTDCAWR